MTINVLVILINIKNIHYNVYSGVLELAHGLRVLWLGLSRRDRQRHDEHLCHNHTRAVQACVQADLLRAQFLA
jgi:hypothetical protein